MKSLLHLCNAYNKLKKEQSDPDYLKFGISIVEDLYEKLGISDPCSRKPKVKRKQPDPPKPPDPPPSIESPGLPEPLELPGQPKPPKSPEKSKKPEARAVVFDSSPYESTRCMYNTAFNKLEARIIMKLRDEILDKDLMEKVLEVFELECKELTPVDTGTLVNSLYKYVEFSEDKVIGVIGYDIGSVFRITEKGEKVYYALAVHNREANHNNPPRATWRFLEIAFENQYIRSIAREILK